MDALPDRNYECPNGPLASGEWPCLRGPRDECLVCGWQPPRVESRWVVLARQLIADLQAAVGKGTGVRSW